MRVEISLKCWPTSANRMTINVRNGKSRIKSAEYRQFEQEVLATILRRGDLSELQKLTRYPYWLTVTLFRPTWLYKNGEAFRVDASNFTKTAEDAVCRVTGWKDQWALSSGCEKGIGPDRTCRLTFEFFDRSAMR